jgi:hypothetical protein
MVRKILFLKLIKYLNYQKNNNIYLLEYFIILKYLVEFLII